MNLGWKETAIAFALIAIAIWFIYDAVFDNHRGAIAIAVIGAFAAGFLLGALASPTLTGDRRTP